MRSYSPKAHQARLNNQNSLGKPIGIRFEDDGVRMKGTTMKLNKPAAIVGTFIAIGSRGTAIAELKQLEGGLVLGSNPILEKERFDMDLPMSEQPLWVRSCSWIEKRQNKTFQLLKVEDALKKGLITKANVRFTGDDTGKTYSGVAYLPKGYKLGMKQPQNIAVQAAGWKFGRIEAKHVRRPDSNESRNAHLVAKLLVDGQPKVEAKPAAKKEPTPTTRKDVRKAAAAAAKAK